MTEPRFPWYVETHADKAEMAYWCPHELAAWRAAVAKHWTARANGGTAWAALAAAYSRLEGAYRNAMSYAEHECAAAA